MASLVLVPLLQWSFAANDASASTGPEWLPFKGSYANAVGCTWGNGCAGGYHGYAAIDFMVPYGTPVYAAGDGNLTGFGGCAPNGGPENCGPDNFGNAVKIAHSSGRDSWYAHLSSVARGNGAVKAGDLLGHTGNSGKSYGSHLHYEERPTGGGWGTQVDPGGMNAIHDGRTVSYPGVLGYGSWSQVPCGVQNGEPCTARHTVRGDGFTPPPPPGSQVPFGNYDQAQSAEAGRVHVSGWAIDNDARTSPVTIHVYVGGEAGDAGAEGHDLGAANVSRPDVGAAHTGAGDQHGFDTAFTTGKTGAQPVCVYAINIGGGDNPLLGCKTVTIEDPQPFGALDTAEGGPGTVHVRGWAVDRNAGTSPTAVHVYVGGEAGASGAEGHDIGLTTTDRPDIGAAHPWAGSAHGFDTVIDTQKRGTQQICAYAINTGPGENKLLGCRTTSVAEPAPEPDPEPEPNPDPTPEREVAPPPTRETGVTRFAGADRFMTAAATSSGSFPGTANDVFIVTGTNWPDALSAGPAAAKVNAPVLPVQTASIPDLIAREIDRLQPRRAWIVGGASVVSDSVLTALRDRGIEVIRVSGAGRYETAAAVAARFFPDATGAYYASGAGYADALGGGAAAAKRGWPLLLTAKDSLPTSTPKIGSERIVLGGPAAVSDNVKSQLGARRVAGNDRFSTAAAIARDAFPSATVGYLATGLNFPDALAGAPAAARDNAPLLLAATDCVTTATRDAFSALGVTSRVALGGTAVVSDRAANLTTC